jgi:hypothetical protein
VLKSNNGDKVMSKTKGTALKFVKLKTVSQIPRYLLEQVKPLEFDIDRFYDWAPLLIDNPLNLMGGFIDQDQEIKGIMWVSYNPMTNKLTVQVLSIDKKYYGMGIMNEIKGILNKLRKNVNAEKIDSLTTRGKALAKLMGAKESKFKIMEI